MIGRVVVEFTVAISIILRLTGDNKRLVGERRPSERQANGSLRLSHHWRKGVWRIRTRHKHREARIRRSRVFRWRDDLRHLVEKDRCIGIHPNR